MESYTAPPRASTPNTTCAPSQALLRATAHAALARGISVLPPTEDGAKRPIGPAWKRYQEVRATPMQVDVWYGPRAGLGFVCGAVSGGLELFEFDDRKTYERFKGVAEATGLGELVRRVEAGYLEDTPGGGVHWFYFNEDVRESTKLACRFKTTDEFNEADLKAIENAAAKGREHRPVKTLIETKGEGGYVVVAPSYGAVHPTGNPYRLIRGNVSTITTITASEREALWELARSFDEMPRPVVTHPATGRKREAASAEGVIAPWDDFNARAEWAEVIPDWPQVYSHGGTVYLRRPGKDRGVSATLNHNGLGLLHVFSTSTGIPAGKSYDRIGAYVWTRHGGDFRAAARALSEAGYGTFLADIWDEEGGKWFRETRPNPCPKGGLVRIATEGRPLPDRPPRGSRWLTRGNASEVTPQTAAVDPAPSSNGHAEPPAVGPQPSSNGDGHKGNGAAAASGSFAPPRLTDLGNAERLAGRHGRDIRHVHPWRKWLVWDGRRWSIDNTAAISRLGKETIGSMYAQAAALDDAAERSALAMWAVQSEDRRQFKAMIEMAAAEPGIPVLPSQLDRNPWVLNCLNGTLDLRSGILGPHLREELITQLAPVEFDPSAVCPQWESTLNLIFQNNRALIRYWQMVCGVALTGVVSEQYLPILYGKGSNGKSTVVNVLMGMLGPDYAMKAPPDLLLMRRQESHPTERASLYGKRLVVAIETGESRRLNEELVKELTGSDPITARRMREDFWTFDPTHKVWLATNHRPTIQGTDHGIWRRLQLVPFTTTIPDDQAIKDMPARLAAEYPGILAWCVRGCLEWRKEGRLTAPEEVSQATNEYRRDEDILGAFLEEHCLINPPLRVKASALYERYKAWAERSGEDVASQKRFGNAMTERGFGRLTNNGTWYLGIGLRPNAPDSD